MNDVVYENVSGDELPARLLTANFLCLMERAISSTSCRRREIWLSIAAFLPIWRSASGPTLRQRQSVSSKLAESWFLEASAFLEASMKKEDESRRRLVSLLEVDTYCSRFFASCSKVRILKYFSRSEMSTSARLDPMDKNEAQWYIDYNDRPHHKPAQIKTIIIE